MKDVVLDACERAMGSMEETDCDDAGINSMAFIGWFWGKWWYVTQCIEYEPDPGLTDEYTVLVCNDDSNIDPRGLESVFSHCEQQVFLGKELSAEDLAYQIREWHNLGEARNLMQE
jgi:hypothetical protein